MRASSGRSISEAAPRRWPRATRLAISAQLVLALGAWPAPASASVARTATQEQTEADWKARADAAMDGGAYAEAIAGYRAAYELARNPALLYNIGSAYERLGDYPRALAYLERFSLVAPRELRARVPTLDELIASLRARLALVAVGCNVPGARVLVRGAWKATTPLAASIATFPGLARVEAVADGYQPFARDVVLAAGKETRLEAVLVGSGVFASTPRESPAPVDDGLTTKWWFWTSVGVVVAGGATAAIVALTSHRSASDQPTGTRAASVALVRW